MGGDVEEDLLAIFVERLEDEMGGGFDEHAAFRVEIVFDFFEFLGVRQVATRYSESVRGLVLGYCGLAEDCA